MPSIQKTTQSGRLNKKKETEIEERQEFEFFIWSVSLIKYTEDL